MATITTEPAQEVASPETKTQLGRKLPLPGTAARGKVLWSYAIPLTLIHLLALGAFTPWFFSWTGVAVWAVSHYLFGMIGITLCYHRYLSHRSFEAPKWVQRWLDVMALWCFEDTPIRWVATHRMHHNHSDEPNDPHSPLASFFWGHMGWLLIRNEEVHNFGVYQKYARDLMNDRFYMALERTKWLRVAIYLSQAPVYFGIGFVLSLLGGGVTAQAVSLGWSTLFWGMLVRTVTVWHVTWSVNSLTHVFGYRNFDTTDESRNNWLVGWVAAGEGWHNNHHHDPAAATVQIRWWEVDTTYYFIKLMEKLGMARNVIPPRHVRRNEPAPLFDGDGDPPRRASA